MPEGIRDLMLNRLGEGDSPAPPRDRTFEDQVIALERLKEALNDDDGGISQAVRALESFIRITMKSIESESKS